MRERTDPPDWLARTWEYGGILTGVVGIVGALVILVGLNQWVESLDATLTVTENAVGAADQTIAVVEDALGIVRDVIGSADGVTGQTADTLREVTSVTASIILLMDEELPSQIESMRGALDGLIDTAGVVDGILSAGAFFGLDYDPDVPLDDALRDVDRELGQLPGILSGEADNLLSLASSIVDLSRVVDGLSADIGRLDLEIADAQRLIVDYRVTAGDASLIVTEVSDSLRTQARFIRVIVLLGGLSMAALGSRLWWVGVRERPSG